MDKPFPLPVRTIGPGSQAEEEELQYLAMPRDMATFAMPRVPETAPPEALASARDLLADFLAAFERWDPATTPSYVGKLSETLRLRPEASLRTFRAESRVRFLKRLL